MPLAWPDRRYSCCLGATRGTDRRARTGADYGSVSMTDQVLTNSCYVLRSSGQLSLNYAARRNILVRCEAGQYLQGVAMKRTSSTDDLRFSRRSALKGLAATAGLATVPGALAACSSSSSSSSASCGGAS